jgi:hypothetical protein
LKSGIAMENEESSRRRKRRVKYDPD